MKINRFRRSALIASLALVTAATGLIILAYDDAVTGRPHRTGPSDPNATGAAAPMLASRSGATTPSPFGSLFAAGSGTTVTYPVSETVIANPERGFTHLAQCQDDAPSAATLTKFRTQENITVLWCVFSLANYRTTDIAAAVLARIDNQFAAVRAAGLKMVLRFSYTEDEAGDDAAPAIVLRHIAQLKPHLRDNADVILAVQAGFVGSWGEWYYTQHYGNAGSLTRSDRANRKAVLDALLDAVPETRMIQVRTPAFKQGYVDLSRSPSSRTRVGFHNDCFLASDTDMGTYAKVSADKAYLAAETSSVVMGGETCASNPPRTQCTTALSELGQFHWTYLNTDYQPDVIAGWKSGGCYQSMQRRLGYQLVLQQGIYPRTVSKSDGLPIQITLRNTGFAAPVNPRKVELVLVGATGMIARRISVDADPRTWQPGTTVSVQAIVPLPADLTAGSYRLALALPDPSSLSSRPEYAIRTANAGLWNAADGINDLQHTVVIAD